MTTIGSLFSGYSGLDMAVEAVTGGHTVWHSDIDPGACKILAHHWPDVPNLGDISAVDWSQVQPVDIITGGFPCTDVSMAGARAGLIRSGDDTTRSGLWAMMANAIRDLRPSLVVIENVRGLLSAAADSDVEPCPWCMGDVSGEPPLRALGAVLGDLADIGYDAAWHGLTAASVGAPHGRFRVFVVAWPQSGDTDSIDQQGWPTAGLTREAGPKIGPASDADEVGRHGRLGKFRSGRWGQLANGRGLPTDAEGSGPQGARPEPARGGPERGDTPAADADRDTVWQQPVAESGGDGAPVVGQPVSWGQFEPAIRRWERLTRPAPAPTETSSRGGQRLSPRFVEWLMGLPEGHVTGVPGLSRNEQLKALGNGVVPQQAEAALRVLLNAMAVAA